MPEYAIIAFQCAQKRKVDVFLERAIGKELMEYKDFVAQTQEMFEILLDKGTKELLEKFA